MGRRGVASLPPEDAARPPEVEKVLPWVGAFGEGFAMLAAAGGPDVHPHEHSPAADRERWDRDVARFDQDLASLQAFFLDVLKGHLATDEAIRGKGLAFFGEQGAFYTVGWRMAVLVERRFGRRALVEGMRHPARLLATYNLVAEEQRARGEGIATWSPGLLRRLGAEPIPVAPGSRPASRSR